MGGCQLAQPRRDSQMTIALETGVCCAAVSLGRKERGLGDSPWIQLSPSR